MTGSRFPWLLIPLLLAVAVGVPSAAFGQETAPGGMGSGGELTEEDLAAARSMRLIDPPEGFDDSAFRIDGWGGWRILNVDGREPDALSIGGGAFFRFSRWRVRVGFEVPVREGRIAFRADDLNEVSDYFWFLRQVQYAEKGEQRFFFRLGELSGTGGTIGHGSIVDSYHSVTDYNSRHIGMQIDLDFRNFGFETLVNSFTGWNVAAARGYIRPLEMAGDRHPVLKDFIIAATIAGDVTGPESLETVGGIVQLDGRRNIRSDGDPFGIIGVDLDLPLVLTEDIELKVYADFAQIIDYGNGWFIGSEAVIHIPLWSVRPLKLRVEGQIINQGFIPSYFDSHYEIERYAFPALTSSTTKGAYLNQAEATLGVKASLEWGVEKLLVFHASFAEYFTDRDNELGRLVLSLSTAPDARLPLLLSATWIKRGVSSFRDAFALDDRAMLRVSASWRFSDDVPIQLGLTIERIWAIDVATGRYESIDAWYPWLGVSIGW